MKEPTFKINPRFRLTTKHLSVVWHCVDKFTIECEATMKIPDQFVFQDKNAVELLVQYHDGILDMIYHDSTDFETKKIQKWLRELMRDTILRIAKVVLPAKGLHGSGYCTFNNHITLQPFLVIFKQEWTDGVILHEMAHYKYKHHRKSFWTFLSTLIGEYSKMVKAKDDIAMSPYYNYYLYLTKNK